MGRRTLSYRKLAALEDARKLGQLEALGELGKATTPDPTAEIPATGPEKLVYNYLKRLRIRFQFQYHEIDAKSTAFPEDVYIPDFVLPDYNSRIEVFGTYWHSMAKRRARDLIKMGYQLYSGRVIIEHGIPLFPEHGAIGKFIIWWEYEIYFDLSHLFTRDLPELFAPERFTGQPEEYLLNREQEERRREAQKARLIAARMVPKVTPFERRLKRLRKRTYDLSKTYPILRQMRKEVAYKIPRGVHETRGKTRPRRYSSLKASLEKYL